MRMQPDLVFQNAPDSQRLPPPLLCLPFRLNQPRSPFSCPRPLPAALSRLAMPVALGADSPLPYSSRPFGVASVVLAPPVLSTPVELEAGMSTAGSRAPVSCSTVVGSAQATSGVGGSTPVPASFLAPAAIVAPPPVPVVAPSHVPPPGVLHSPAAEQADAVMMASASGEAPPPAPVQVPSPVAALAVSEARAAVSPGVPDGTSAPPFPLAYSSAPAQPLAVQQRQSQSPDCRPSRPHSPT
ncbi:unnamed protein product [Closterium sp. NIES-53]